jgi:glycosyltransferase involved in cell wall biosynthesis
MTLSWRRGPGSTRQILQMKLLFIHECFGAFAGAESNLLHSAVELRRRGHTVGILHGRGTGKNEAAWTDAFANCYRLTTHDNFRVAQTAIHDFAPDVIYVHKMDDLEVLKALLSTRQPVVRMVHDHEMYCMRGYKYNCVSREICTRPLSMHCLFPCGAFLTRNHEPGLPVRWKSYLGKKKEVAINQRFHRLIVATDYMKQELVRNQFALEKIQILPPVPPSGTEAPRSSFSDRNLLIYAGQIIRGKGVDVLLEALAQVQAPYECVILGDGNHRAYCEERSQALGLEGRVTFTGYVPQAQLQDYYREASAMVLSSVWAEPFGAVGLEGMRHGLPVVAFDAGGIKEWLADGENGFLVPWMNCSRYAQRVTQLLLDKPLARQLGDNGRRLVAERYDFGKYVDGLEVTLARAAAEATGAVHA